MQKGCTVMRRRLQHHAVLSSLPATFTVKFSGANTQVRIAKNLAMRKKKKKGFVYCLA